MSDQEQDQQPPQPPRQPPPPLPQGDLLDIQGHAVAQQQQQQLPQVHQQGAAQLQAPLVPHPPPIVRPSHPVPPLPVSPQTGEPVARKDSKKRRQPVLKDSSGMENPFVPASVSSSFTKFKQLSTRRRDFKSIGHVVMAASKKQRTISSPSIGATGQPITYVHGAVVSVPLTGADAPLPVTPPPSATATAPPTPLPLLGKTSSYPLPPVATASTVPVSAPPTTTSPASIEDLLSDIPKIDYPTLKATDVEPQKRPQPEEPMPKPPPATTAAVATTTVSTIALPPMPSPPVSTVSATNGHVGEHQPVEEIPVPNIGLGFSLKPPSMTQIPPPTGPLTAKIAPGGVGGFPQGMGPRASFSGSSGGHYLDPAQWTVVDEVKDHPGMRRHSGFFQPIRHLSGRKQKSCICSLFIQKKMECVH